MLRRTICAMDKNKSGKPVNQVVRLTRHCGKPFVARKINGQWISTPLMRPALGPVPEGGGKVIWIEGIPPRGRM